MASLIYLSPSLDIAMLGRCALDVTTAGQETSHYLLWDWRRYSLLRIALMGRYSSWCLCKFSMVKSMHKLFWSIEVPTQLYFHSKLTGLHYYRLISFGSIVTRNLLSGLWACWASLRLNRVNNAGLTTSWICICTWLLPYGRRTWRPLVCRWHWTWFTRKRREISLLVSRHAHRLVDQTGIRLADVDNLQEGRGMEREIEGRRKKGKRGWNLWRYFLGLQSQFPCFIGPLGVQTVGQWTKRESNSVLLWTPSNQ